MGGEVEQGEIRVDLQETCHWLAGEDQATLQRHLGLWVQLRLIPKERVPPSAGSIGLTIWKVEINDPIHLEDRRSHHGT